MTLKNRLEPRIPLGRAADIFFPHGGITTSSLRTEVRNGRLVVERIAGKDFVTESAIEDMLVKCRVEQDIVVDCQPASQVAATGDKTNYRARQAALDRVRARARERKKR